MKKRNCAFLSLVIVAALITCFAFTGNSYAADEKPVKQENKVVKFFKNLIIWPFGITKEGAETAGRTTKSAVTTVTSTATSSVEMVTGKPEKIKDVIVDPVKGSVETGYTAVEGSIMTPVKGTEDAFGSKEKPSQASEQQEP